MANLVLVLSLLFALSGCKSFEDRCLERFPIVTLTEVRNDTLTDTLILPDTFVEYIDTTYCPPNLTDTLVVIKPRFITLPGDTLIHEYYCTDTVIVQRDLVRVKYLESAVAKMTTRHESDRRKVRSLWLVIIILGLVLALWLALALGGR